MKETLLLGTRGSALALWQSRTVASQMDIPVELKIIKTTGDKLLDIPLQGRVEKGFFTKEIENYLLSGETDLAVHSLKDLPTEMHPELTIGAYLPRASVSDVLLIHPDWLDPDQTVPLRKGCKVGATSLRRQALLKLYAPQAEATFLRGNVPSRIGKCQREEYGAIILARAGIERLKPDLGDLLLWEFNPAIWLPAPGQGVIAVQARKDDEEVLKLLSKIDDYEARHGACIERGLLSRFEGGCHTAFGAWAKTKDKEWMVKVGLEETEKGWGHMEFLASLEETEKQGPKTLQDFKALAIDNQKELCWPL